MRMRTGHRAKFVPKENPSSHFPPYPTNIHALIIITELPFPVPTLNANSEHTTLNQRVTTTLVSVRSVCSNV